MLVAAALSGCHAAATSGAVAAGAEGRLTAAGAEQPKNAILSAPVAPGVHVTANVEYGTADGQPLLLDVCAPPPPTPGTESAGPAPAVISVHGGSWTMGDKAGANWRAVCEWLASAGFVTYSVDYRLVPHAIFPAAVDDVTQAVRWVREPANAARFGIDPARVGILGGSAGASIASLVGMRGSGPTTSGDRVSAVVDLSGPVDLTAAGQRLGHPVPYVPRIELAYLGCTAFDACPQARAASAVYDVDPSDPPVFIAQSSNELIPREQGDAFAAALEAAGVRHSVTTVPGHGHSIEILSEAMRTDIAAFLHRELG